VWRQEDAGKCSEYDEDRMVQTKTVRPGLDSSNFSRILGNDSDDCLAVSYL